MILAILGRLFGRERRAPDRPLDELDDESLMLAFAQGDHLAFEELLRRHEQAVLRFVTRHVSSRTLAEDLTQDIFLRVCKSASRYTPKAKFTTWLYTIARNRCIDHARRQGTRHEVSLDAPSSPEDDDDRARLDTFSDHHAQMGSSTVVRQEFQRHLMRALDDLPESQREVFLLREVSGLKFREIADVLDISENTVKSRMRYALQALRGALASYRDFSFDADENADAQHLR